MKNDFINIFIANLTIFDLNERKWMVIFVQILFILKINSINFISRYINIQLM